MHPMLSIAIKAARRAGNMINRVSINLETLQAESKRPTDFITEIVKTVEGGLIEVIATAYPDHDIWSEETGHANEANRDSEHCWIVKAIEGLTNFDHGFPDYAVSLALSFRETIVLAVVFDPTRNELYTATKGKGAFFNDRRMRVSGRIRLDEAIVGANFHPTETEPREAFWSKMRQIDKACAGSRLSGVTALDLARLAAGRLDGFWGVGLSPWDLAAGSLLVTEAGGLVTDDAGEGDYLDTGRVVAGSPKVFSALLERIQKI